LKVALRQGNPEYIEFRDAESNDLIWEVPATLPGWSAEAMLVGLRGWGLEDLSFSVGNDEEAVSVHAPWSAGEEWGESVVKLAEAFYTLTITPGPNYSVAGFDLWRSIDGLSWSLVEVPNSWESIRHVELFGGDGSGALLKVSALDGNSTVLASRDGRTWQEANVVSDHLWYRPTDFGWIGTGLDSHSISANGLDWEPLQTPVTASERSVLYMGGKFFFVPMSFGDRQEMWVGEFAS
jgi:hypothetical protein